VELGRYAIEMMFPLVATNQRNVRHLVVVGKETLKPVFTVGRNCNSSNRTSIFSSQAFRGTAISFNFSHGKSSKNIICGGISNTTSRWVSSASCAEERWIGRPSNLIFHPKVTCSPFFGLQKAKEKAATQPPPAKSEQQEPEEELYDLSSLPERYQPRRAIPLPQRLHVQVHQFYNDAHALILEDDHDDSNSNTSEDSKREGTVEENDHEVKNARSRVVVGTVQLPSDIFGKNPIRTDLIHRVVVYQRNKKRGKRNGGARTKTISEVSGSGKKMRQQKGTGMARCGHKRPPHWRGGAKAHGPKGSIQDYTTKLNKKVRKLGLCHALSQKLYEGNLIVVDQMAVPTFKTNPLAKILSSKFNITGSFGSTALLLDHQQKEVHATDTGTKDQNALVLGGVNANLRIASRNLFQVKLLNQMGANVYDIIKHEKLMISLPALQQLEQRLT